MKPKGQSPDALELFQAYFDQLLNPSHALVKLARQIDWEAFEKKFAGCYCEDFGAPAKATGADGRAALSQACFQ